MADTEKKTEPGRLAEQTWMIAPETMKVMAALTADGGAARFVGGCVRDALSNRKVIDIDIATPLRPEAVIERLTAHKIGYAPTGLKHGTVTAIADGKPFEITTLRIDAVSHGRHADVAYTDSWEADAARRDFTFNAMSATIEGKVFDYFGGVRDLAEGRVVFVGDPAKRIEEDVLRILRFFRFLAHFGRGAPDAAALKACAKAAHLIPRLSAERLRQETLKLLDAPRAASVWRLMVAEGVAGQYLPEATDVAALERLAALEEDWHAGIHPLRRLAALLVVNAEGLAEVCKSLRLSNAQSAQLAAMALPAEKITDENIAQRFVYHHGGDAARALLLLDGARGGDLAALKPLYHIATAFRAPRFPVQGADILKLGVKPGPDVGRALKEIESWWLEENFKPGRTACLARLKEWHRG